MNSVHAKNFKINIDVVFIYIPNVIASFFKIRVGDYSLQKCSHEEIKIKFRLVRRLDGTISFP